MRTEKLEEIKDTLGWLDQVRPDALGGVIKCVMDLISEMQRETA